MQQPSMRQTRWHVAEATCSVWTSSSKAASASAGTPLVCIFLTATCVYTFPSKGYSLQDFIGWSSSGRAKHTFTTCLPNCKSAWYTTTPRAPRAKTAPNVKLDGGMLNAEASAIFAYADGLQHCLLGRDRFQTLVCTVEGQGAYLQALRACQGRITL